MRIAASQTQVCRLKLGPSKARSSTLVAALPEMLLLSLDSDSGEGAAFQNSPCASGELQNAAEPLVARRDLSCMSFLHHR